VGVIGLEALVAVDRQFGERASGLLLQRPFGVHIAAAVPPGRDAHALPESAQHPVAMPASWVLQARPTDRNRPAAPSQCRARPSTPTTVSGLPWSHVRLQG